MAGSLLASAKVNEAEGRNSDKPEELDAGMKFCDGWGSTGLSIGHQGNSSIYLRQTNGGKCAFGGVNFHGDVIALRLCYSLHAAYTLSISLAGTELTG
jgi:hypothetical protein